MKIVKSLDQFVSELNDQIPGGISDKLTPQYIADKHGVSLEEIEAALDKGQKVEMEHTDDAEKAREIAKDHLLEDPQYYEKLAKMEGEPTNEAAKVETERYFRSHMKQPKGYGKWMFSYNKNGDDPFEIPGSMSYADATKWVKAKAKEDGKDYIYVMEGINDFSPLSYAKKVANKIISLADAAKEADMPQTELLKLVRKFDKNFKMTYEANDHEVGMAQGQLDAIHKDAAELQEKIGAEERDLPGWIQSHITSAYEYLKQANDNFHELKEEEKVDEALKMLMDPLMLKIMKQFGFNTNPGIKAELRAEIKAAVEEVLKKHDIIVEGTFNDGEIAIYTDPRGDAGETQIWKRGKGYYGQNDSFDFEAKDKKELEMKLKRWGYVLIAGSIDEAFQAEAEEPLAKLALSLLAIRDQAHMFHWQTQSYEQHMAFGEFYEDFVGKMDELMENIMGKSERPAFVSGTITLAGYSDSEVIEFINTAKNVFDLQLPTVVPTEGNSEIYNLVEEILSMLNKLQYLLSLK
jgi:lysophospholipase L1-like esterase